ncbi:NTP transferase domain-containing protein [Rhizobium leguminosarum]
MKPVTDHRRRCIRGDRSWRFHSQAVARRSVVSCASGRILAGAHPNAYDIGRMGVGGLLMEIQTRSMPRETLKETSLQPKVAIVLLAAGMATRMGPNGGHKLLAAFDGMPLVRRSALIAMGSDAASVTVVVGHRQDDIRKVLVDLPVTISQIRPTRRAWQVRLQRALPLPRPATRRAFSSCSLTCRA